MKHARPDYDRIQDPEDKIPADEPVFLLRGQDVIAPLLVEQWAANAEHLGVSAEMVDAARLQARAMRSWQCSRAKKTPDLPSRRVEVGEAEAALNEMIDRGADPAFADIVLAFLRQVEEAKP